MFNQSYLLQESLLLLEDNQRYHDVCGHLGLLRPSPTHLSETQAARLKISFWFTWSHIHFHVCCCPAIQAHSKTHPSTCALWARPPVPLLTSLLVPLLTSWSMRKLIIIDLPLSFLRPDWWQHSGSVAPPQWQKGTCTMSKTRRNLPLLLLWTMQI